MFAHQGVSANILYYIINKYVLAHGELLVVRLAKSVRSCRA